MGWGVGGGGGTYPGYGYPLPNGPWGMICGCQCVLGWTKKKGEGEGVVSSLWLVLSNGLAIISVLITIIRVLVSAEKLCMFRVNCSSNSRPNNNRL